MLRHLTIQNFALITHHEVHFDYGMTVITGETGAGKSIVIDALSLALGSRADTQMIRHEESKCTVTAEFIIDNLPQIQNWLDEHDLSHEQDCIIRRVVQRDGKSRAFINGNPVPIMQLAELGDLLVDLHGQHEHQSLLKKDQQLRLIDQFGQHHQLLTQIKTLYQQWKVFENEKAQLQQAQDKTALRELYQFQHQELENLALKEGEVEQLEAEFKKLNQADTILQRCQNALNLLDEDDVNLCHLLNQTLQQISTLADISEELKNARINLDSAHVVLQEAAHDIRHYLDDFKYSPERLDEISRRLDEIHRIARKHHVSATELMALQEKLVLNLRQLENSGERLAQIDQAQQQLFCEYEKLAKQLTKQRESTAKKLSTFISEKMHALAMGGGKFSVKFIAQREGAIYEYGQETCEFLVAANPDQPLQALNKVASGGELSRISLAIQVILASQATSPTLIFDEVDVGIGGATAAIVGQLLKMLGKNTQVICITHLPQVAAFGDQHIRIQKKIVDNMTQTSLEKLSLQDRQHEIARMLGGIEMTKQSLANAKALIDQAKSL